MKIREGYFSDFRKHFVLNGYRGFQDKADKVGECGIDIKQFMPPLSVF